MNGLDPSQNFDYLYKAGVAAILGRSSSPSKAACAILDILLEE